MSMGSKLAQARRKNNLTQEQLADLMNCNFKTVGNLENDRTVPDLKQIINLCDVLNISMDELFADVLHKTDGFVEPSENDESYPFFVNRRVADVPLSQLKKIETLSLKLRKLNEKELNIVDALIDSLMQNR